MLIHVLGLLDLLSAGVLLGGHYGLFKIPLLYAAVYLLSKLFLFRDTMSFIDAAAAIYCIFVFFGLTSGIIWVFIIYFAYKTSVWLFFSMAN